jgi:hypothetical protein
MPQYLEILIKEFITLVPTDSLSFYQKRLLQAKIEDILPGARKHGLVIIYRRGGSVYGG